MIPSRGIRGHGRGVHSPRCMPSHLLDLGKAVESRHIPVLMLLDAFDGDVDACTSVGVVLMPTVPALEPLFVTVHTLRMPADWTLLAGVLRVNPRNRDALEGRLVGRIELKGAEREVVQAPVHPRAVVDTVAHLFEVFKDDARILELLAPLRDVTANLVESVTDEPFFSTFERFVHTRFLGVLHPLSNREVAVALELDFGKVDNQRIFDATLG